MNYKKEAESVLCLLCERKEDTTEHVIECGQENEKMYDLKFTGKIKEKEKQNQKDQKKMKKEKRQKQQQNNKRKMKRDNNNRKEERKEEDKRQKERKFMILICMYSKKEKSRL